VSEERSAALLTLACVPGLAPRQRQALLEAFGEPAAVCAASVAELRRHGATKSAAERIRHAVEERLGDRARDEAAALGITVALQGEPAYPEALTNLPDPPTAFFHRGTFRAEDGYALAMVGARRCSRWGGETSRRFAHALAQAGCTIVSGGARGIDGAAHRGALDGGGRTIVVLGGGVAEPYPGEHRDLFDEIVEREAGVVCSELPPSAAPLAKTFPQRNRIIAALATGVLLVEGTERSGANHTIRSAAELGREVFAVPGRAGDPLAVTPNRLLRDGAHWAMEPADVLAALPVWARPPERVAGASAPVPAPPARVRPRDPVLAAVLDAVAAGPRAVIEIAEAAGLEPAGVSAALTRLEIGGFVSPLPGGRWGSRAVPSG
jgi:DNA processing protein